VQNSVNRILQESEAIKGLIDEGKVGIISAMYDLSTGIVNFYDAGNNNLAIEEERATMIATR
jgi:carbonic anhydrase